MSHVNTQKYISNDKQGELVFKESVSWRVDYLSKNITRISLKIYNEVLCIGLWFSQQKYYL